MSNIPENENDIARQLKAVNDKQHIYVFTPYGAIVIDGDKDL